MNDWLPWVVGAIGIISAGSLSWPTVLKLLKHFQTAPLAPKPADVPSDEPEIHVFTENRKLSRQDAFAAIDDLSDYFGEQGSKRGMEAVRNAGLAMYDPEAASE